MKTSIYKIYGEMVTRRIVYLEDEYDCIIHDLSPETDKFFDEVMAQPSVWGYNKLLAMLDTIGVKDGH